MSLIKNDPQIAKAISLELKRQRETIELIASENFASEDVLEAQGSVLTNKYAEGYPGKRYYGGCDNVDTIEKIAKERALKLFPPAEHANVQPHSGTQANMAVYFSVLNPGDTIMGMHLNHGGHLSHGHPANFSGKYFKVVPVTLRCDDELLDYDRMEISARQHRPKLIVAGSSSYSRVIDWEKIKNIAASVGAYLMADVAHYAGLIAAGIYPSPVPYADFVTFTTHKTMRGPRGGVILCKEKFAAVIDKTVFPGIQGGPLMHVIAAKAVAFNEALKPSFRTYQKQVLKNARAFAERLRENGFRIISGGTDCHMFMVDVSVMGLTGKDAQEYLEKSGITVNKNAIPYDKEKPAIASGIRIGTPAVTTRGMKEKEIMLIADAITDVLKNKGSDEAVKRARQTVKTLCRKFPLYR